MAGGGAMVQRNEVHSFVVLPQCWVVERSFGCLDKCHKLWKNCERRIHNLRQIVVLAFIAIILKRF
jgi:transposase